MASTYSPKAPDSKSDDELSIEAILDTPMNSEIPKPIVKKYLNQPPFIPLEGALNLRDACHAPIPCLRAGVLYRSGTLSHLVPDGRVALSEEYGIDMIIDLRSLREIGSAENQKSEQQAWASAGVILKWLPGRGEPSPLDLASYVEGNGEKGWKASYSEIAEQFKEAVKALMEHIADDDTSAVLVNCTAGKDRTGVLVAIALLLAGADQEYIERSYLLTRLGIEPYRGFLTAKMMQWVAHEHPEAGTRTTEELAEKSFQDYPGLRNYGAVNASTMRVFVTWLEEKYGGVEGYLRSCGLEERIWQAARAHMREQR